MGYYTKYELEIISGNDYETDYEREISVLADYYNCFNDAIKWYSHKEDMIKYSKKYPSVLFLLKGEGEETGDIWRAYFQNGKMFRTKATILFEEFSIEKLQ